MLAKRMKDAGVPWCMHWLGVVHIFALSARKMCTTHSQVLTLADLSSNRPGSFAVLFHGVWFAFAVRSFRAQN